MTKEKGKIVCIGELLIDFFCMDVGTSLIEGENFKKQAGGAPANVCAAIARLGGHSSFAGKVGDDPFGHFLKQTLNRYHVDTTMLLFDRSAPTTIAFVSLDENGERDFIFHRGADANVRSEDMNWNELRQVAIVHFGSATAMMDEPFRQTYFDAMEDAVRNNCFVSFDPNYRVDLWFERVEEFIAFSKRGIAMADLVKVSEEELQLIAGTADREAAVHLLHQLGAKRVAVTLGKAGTYISDGVNAVQIPSIPVRSIDSTGAGDAFVGALLYQISILNNAKELDFEMLKSHVHFANKVGAIACTKVGAISSLPTLKEVNELTLHDHQIL